MLLPFIFYDAWKLNAINKIMFNCWKNGSTYTEVGLIATCGDVTISVIFTLDKANKTGNSIVARWNDTRLWIVNIDSYNN